MELFTVSLDNKVGGLEWASGDFEAGWKDKQKTTTTTKITLIDTDNSMAITREKGGKEVEEDKWR